MKHYQQNGMTLKRTYLHESGNICTCCEDFLHGKNNESYESLMDDAECTECHSLCSCSCHREKN